MNREYVYRRGYKNLLETPTIHWGYGYKSTPHLIYETNHYMIWRIPSCLDWKGRGETAYYKARFYLMEKLQGKDEYNNEKAIDLEVVEYDRKTRMLELKKLIVKVTELESIIKSQEG